MHISAVFDPGLNYLVVSDRVCEQLKKSRLELIGKNLIELFPEVAASTNHRNLLRALDGQKITDIIQGRKGEYFNVAYHPVFNRNFIIGVYTEALRKTFAG